MNENKAESKEITNMDDNGSTMISNDTNNSELKNDEHIIDHRISDVKFMDLKQSKYIVTKRMTFKQGNRNRIWDLIEFKYDACAALLYHKSKKSFLFVKQFRPPVYNNYLQKNTLITAQNKLYQNNTNKYDQIGTTYECCAGLIDNPNISKEETMVKEIKEECGYNVKVSDLEYITQYSQSVGVSGMVTHMYYCEINDENKVSKGGGLKNSNEFENIELIYVPTKDALKFVLSNDKDMPPGLKFVVYWWFLTKKNSNKL